MSVPDELPETFTYSEARRHGLSDRRIYELRDNGSLEALGRGLYRRADADAVADIDLLEIAYKAPEATLCLASALARHGLTDLIPAVTEVALPRGRRRPVVGAAVGWHLFAPETFDLGREKLKLDFHTTIGIYSAERSIVDAFRLRHREGPELANTALRRWLARPGAQPAALLALARHFPRTEAPLRRVLEVLL
ncbi:type IV toxin-antitoxin system AbiEi family antitoxin domain-containing protein [Amycolatopsis anabasis]|uniref:type IV toxin-antitoxin system AbiEi family antitoxin domain-containing protein n=1 Tax=Amycolatopsis anabasis TaxID=1840409 RepID=UPI001C55458E|nr:type IV toxin-antitoxin system AbiEi family antitoxin domain-containing protein [Amycolatopsis anabasis]